MERTTAIRAIDPDDLDSERSRAVFDDAVRILQDGRLVAFPTETVYGLGAIATNPEAVVRIFGAKGRPPTNPLIVHVSDLSMAQQYTRTWPPTADRIAEHFWPGPITIILPRTSMIPDRVTGARETVGIRIPSNPIARELIRRTGFPLAAPSANRSTGISPTTADHVSKHLAGRIDLIIDGGPTNVGIESTILDLSGEAPTILRPGKITSEELKAVLEEPVLSVEKIVPTNQVALSPGQSAVHYAPQTPTIRLEPGEPWPDLSNLTTPIGVIRFGSSDMLLPTLDQAQATWIHLPEPVIAERRLYEALHRLDDSNATLILVLMPPNQPAWTAIRDRLRRATRSLSETGPDLTRSK